MQRSTNQRVPGMLILNEYGFLPVPPPCLDVRFTDLPGVFGNGGSRGQLWASVRNFSRLLIERTTIREFYLDGDYISAHDKPPAVEVGIELSDGVTNADLKVLDQPFDEEWSLWVNFYAPRRPDTYNFHESFQLPDPEVSRTGLPNDLRKGYLRVKL
jgi:hypothetical protein